MTTKKTAKHGTFRDGTRDIGCVGLARLLKRNAQKTHTVLVKCEEISEDVEASHKERNTPCQVN